MTTNTTNDSIAGLREQIFANAIHAFPRIITLYPGYDQDCRTGNVRPNKIFEIIVATQPPGVETFEKRTEYQASLLWRQPDAPMYAKIALCGEPQLTMEEALKNLLEATGFVVQVNVMIAPIRTNEEVKLGKWQVNRHALFGGEDFLATRYFADQAMWEGPFEG